jgi:hypothetical protein
MGHIIDYSGNIERHGPIDAEIPIRGKKRRAETPKKLCTALMDETIEFEGMTYRKGDTCGYPNLLSAKKCKCCGALFISVNDEGSYIMRTKAQVLKANQDATMETFDVASIYFESGEILGVPTVKMIFYDDYDELIHAHHIKIEHSGQWKNQAVAEIMSMLKNKRDFYEWGKFQNGVCVKSLLFMLGDEYRDKYFNLPKSIKLLQTGRYKHLVSWSF